MIANILFEKREKSHFLEHLPYAGSVIICLLITNASSFDPDQTR